MFNEWERKDFRSAEKITTVSRIRKKPRFGPWMTSPSEAWRNGVKHKPRKYLAKPRKNWL
jgi:hypothetical protein